MIVVDSLFNGESYYHGPMKGQARRVGSRTGHQWCHMMATGGLEELNAFAKRIGLKVEWRDGDHYDLTPSKRVAAIKAGAVGITREQSIEITRWQRFNGPRPAWAHEPQPRLI